MLAKKIISQSMIALQIVTSVWSVSVVRADENAVTTTSTAEDTLVSEVYRIEGTIPDLKEAQKQVIAATQTYLSTAQVEGRQERFTNALIKMNLYSATDVRSFMSDVSNSSVKLSENQFSSNEQAMNQISTELQKVVANHPAVGAQFGGCGMETAGYILILVGTVSFLGGVWMLTNPGYNEGLAAIATFVGLSVSVAIGPFIVMASGCPDSD